MIVKTQKPIKLTNTCNAIYDEATVVKGILDFITDGPVAANKKVFMYGRYPAVSVRQHKLHLHRIVWFAVNGGIPYGHYVHHKDGNRLNNLIENLELMTASEHQRITNLGRKQTKEWTAKRIANGWKTRKKIYENKEL